MHVITIAGSDHQKSRLKNGHKVRVKHGEGFNVVVNPTTYRLVSRSFNKNKGTTMQLSPEEIEMNRAPSPEVHSTIMGHNDHLILPNPMGALVKGSGIGNWFKNKVINPIQNKIINPIQNKVITPITNAYNKAVPENVRRDISTIGRFASVPGMAIDVTKRLAKGDKLKDIVTSNINDLKQLNSDKNKVIKSSPVLTEAYKKGVIATAGLGSAALGSAFGLSPVTGALAGTAATAAANKLLKAEGYGLFHRAIEHGIANHLHQLGHLAKPIGGGLKMSHITNFFKNAGHAIQKGATSAHNFVSSHPELASKIKEHGSKLAGVLAKTGINYLTGSEDYGDMAENLGSKLADEQIHKNLGYGLTAGFTGIGHGLTAGFTGNIGRGLSAGGHGLYASNKRGSGVFHSFNTLRDASNGYAKANELLSNMNHLAVHGQHTQPPIQKYYDGDNAPRSRGTGMHPHTMHHIHQSNHLHHRDNTTHPHDTNLIRGRGTLIDHTAELPPALVSQPYASNFHMQFQLPPQYQKYNDGTHTY